MSETVIKKRHNEVRTALESSLNRDRFKNEWQNSAVHKRNPTEGKRTIAASLPASKSFQHSAGHCMAHQLQNWTFYVMPMDCNPDRRHPERRLRPKNIPRLLVPHRLDKLDSELDAPRGRALELPVRSLELPVISRPADTVDEPPRDGGKLASKLTTCGALCPTLL